MTENLSNVLIPRIFVFSKFLGHKSIIAPKIYSGDKKLIPDFVVYTNETAFVWEWSMHRLDGRKKKQIENYNQLIKNGQFNGEVNFNGNKIIVIFVCSQEYYNDYLKFIITKNLNINLSYIYLEGENHKLFFPQNLKELELINSLQVPSGDFCSIDVDNFSLLKMERYLKEFINKGIFDVDEIILKLMSREIFLSLSPSIKSKLRKAILKNINTLLK